MYDRVREADPAVADSLDDEVGRQRETLAMIASENHVSPAVLEAQGSALTNKYAEGYPGERYYAGCEYADEVEQLAIDRAKELWGADHVNVQPHSGTQANMGVYLAFLDPGDRILSLDLNHGGHLSHGHPANFTGQTYEVEQYEVDPETGYIDYEGLEEHASEIDPAVFPGGQGGPLMHNIAGKAVGFEEALQPEFEEYAAQVVDNARAMAEVFRDQGLHVVSGGTDTHLVLIDLRDSHPELSGGTAEEAMEDCDLVLNANTVPDESRSPFDPSGIRVGTPAMTTRGMDEAAVSEVAHLICDVLDDHDDPAVREEVGERVAALCADYPLYEDL